MNKKIFMVVKVLVILIMVLAVVLQGMIMFGSGDINTSGALEGYFKLAYISLGIAVALALIFAVSQIFSFTRKQFIVMALAIVVLGLLAIISNSVASGTNLSQSFMTEHALTVENAKFIGASLIFTYILIGLAVVSIFATFVVNLFK